MKKLIFALALALPLSSFAVTVVTKLPPFSGKIITATPGLDITSVKFEIDNHFCSIGTCAGGPSDLKEIDALVKISADGSEVLFSSAKPVSNRSFKMFGNFSNCSLKISATGRTQNGEAVDGVVRVASLRTTEECASEAIVGELLKKAFAKPITATAQGGNLNTLRLEPSL